jgi:hypothetical protein
MATTITEIQGRTEFDLEAFQEALGEAKLAGSSTTIIIAIRWRTAFWGSIRRRM